MLPCISNAGHQSAWLSYTSSARGLLVFDTATDETTYDTAVAIWVEEPGGSAAGLLIAAITGLAVGFVLGRVL